MPTIVPDHHLPRPQCRIRHIESLQVRNLTPFPARDAIVQTVTQPSRKSTLLTQSADDSELVTPRRKRRISSGSIMIYNPETEKVQDTPLTGSSSIRSTPKNSLRTVSGSPSAPRWLSSNHHSSFIASRHVVSFTEDDALHVLDTQTPSPLFVIHSQKHLEKIISSRLIETFITLSPIPSVEDIAFPSPSSESMVSPALSAVLLPGAAATKKLKEVSNKKNQSTHKSDHRKGPSVSSLASRKSIPSRPRTPVSPTNTSRSRAGDRASTSKAGFTSPPTPPPESPRARFSTFSSSGKTGSSRPNSRGPDAQQDEPSSLCSTPFYISSIHQPSTNPIFAHFDPEREFANWADITSTKFQVAIWGRIDNSSVGLRGKEKSDTNICPFIWKILDEWTVDLDEVTHFAFESSGHTLPSNTLLLTLTSGDTFCVPPRSAEHHSPTASQSQDSPIEHNYSSDNTDLGRFEEASSKTRDLIAKNMRETRMKKSATYQDLVKLINIQTVIADTQQLLENTIRTCNFLIDDDKYDPPRRELSELEDWVQILRGERTKIRAGIDRDSSKLEGKREMLRRRRENLAYAKDLYRQATDEYSDTTKILVVEQERHSDLASQIPTLRTSLIQLVNFIFPIEPVSPADLLFSILSSPLPVPVSSNDPAPPMSMAAFPTVTEESVSTALGHVAQIVQLISAYLGQKLLYPVTCYGSRSVIRDPISAMVGPRIFPLYSKGVETYRFEYGVFLLNKNIEMFMSERNLRALDIRHTLPNLKNLILTLTTGNDINPAHKQNLQVSEVASPISPVTISEPKEDASTMSSVDLTQQTYKKSTPFFSPFTALLRSRYPSSLGRPKVKPLDELPEQIEEPRSSTDSDSSQLVPEPAPQIRVTVEDGSKDLPIDGNNVSSVDVILPRRNPLEKLSSNAETLSTPSSLSDVA